MSAAEGKHSTLLDPAHPGNARRGGAVEASEMRARRRLGPALIASGVAHAVAALWLAARERPAAEPDEDPELVWAEIELIDPGEAPVRPAEPGGDSPAVGVDSTPAPESPSGSKKDRGSGSRAGAGARSGSGSGKESGSGSRSRSGGEAGSGAWAENGAEPGSRAVDVDPRRAAAAVVPDPGPPAPPGPLEGPRPRKPFKMRSELRPDGPGGFATDDGPFVARTDRQGKVRFEDRSSFRFDVPSPRRMAVDMGRAVERWARDPRRYAEENGNQTRIRLGGQIELTDSIMRAGGQDPYAARKMEFLDRTRDERMRIAAAENRQRLREALHRTRADLERVWSGPGSAAHRRRLLFLLWDECLERGGDDEVHAARAVRGAIVAFVRRRLPAGSRLAYTRAELDGLNARRTSSERFDPYASPRAP